MLYLDGGHCGKGNLMRTMRLVKFEIDPGSSLYIVNTTKTKYNVNCAFTNLHIQPLYVGDRSPPLRNVNHKHFSLSGIISIPFGEDEIDFGSVGSKKVTFIQGSKYISVMGWMKTN